jgi:hypothetical protein
LIIAVADRLHTLPVDMTFRCRELSGSASGSTNSTATAAAPESASCTAHE